jgi:hypothetical protein
MKMKQNNTKKIKMMKNKEIYQDGRSGIRRGGRQTGEKNGNPRNGC